MKRYSEYKDSGIAWIGEIPKHWRHSRLKFHLTENSGGIWGEDVEFGNGINVLRSTEITIGGRWDLQRIAKRKLSKEETEKFLLKKDDLVITKSSGSQDHIGKTGLVDEKIELMYVCYSNFVQRIRPKNHLNSRFLHFFMNCPLAREQYKYQSETTTGLANLNTKSIDELFTLLPPIQEQILIANFLDRKTEQIDELIRIKERQIELLQEQRTALINHAVTKGLDPNVEMKPSGVEWIGEIPKHWEVRRLGDVSTIIKGGTPKRNVDKYFQGDLPWARPVDITALQGVLYIHDTEIHISEEALDKSAARRLPPGTVLLTSRATIGEIAITTVPMATNQGFSNFVCHQHLLNIYLAYYLQAIKDLLISLGSGSAYLEVTKKTLVGVKVPLPPLSEQKRIVDFLDQKIEQIDELKSAEQRKIELLKEYRQSLISEAVTGKIDVRNET